MISLKRIVTLIVFTFSTSFLFGQNCPFIGKWKLMDVEKDKLSILDTTCTPNIILRVDTLSASSKYMFSICDFIGCFEINKNQLVYSGRIPKKSISTLVVCNWSVVMKTINDVDHWSLTNDTLILFNDRVKFTFKAI